MQCLDAVVDGCGHWRAGCCGLAGTSCAVRNIWRAKVGKAVGLFGAIEVALHNGPLLLDRAYLVEAQVIALTNSPKTEGFWFDSSARDAQGTLIATHRMLLRFMNAAI